MSTKIDYKLLARRIYDYVLAQKPGTFKPIRLSPNNSLGQSVRTLSAIIPDVAENGTLTSPDIVEEIITDIVNSMEDQFIQQEAFDPIERMAETFSSRVKDSFNVLAKCQRWVDSIAEDIETKKKLLIASDLYLANASNGIEAGASYESMNWDEFFRVDGFSERDIVDRIHLKHGRIDGMPTASIIQALTVGVNNGLTNKFKGIELSSRSRDELVGRLSKRAGVSTEAALWVFELLTKPRNFASTVASHITKFFSPQGSQVSEVCMDIKRLVTEKFERLRPAITDRKTVDLSKEDQARWDINVQILDQFVELCLYFVVYCRRNTYNDIALLPNGLVNMDNWDCLAAEFKQPYLALKRHETVMYPNYGLKNSPKGISVESLITHKDMVSKKVEIRTYETLNRINYEMQQVMRTAVTQAFWGFIQKGTANKDKPDAPPVVPPYRHSELHGFISSIAARASSPNTDPKQYIYSFLFEVYDVNPFAKVLYNNLGVEYSRVLSTTKDIDETTLKSMETSVVARLVMEFVKKTCLSR